MKPKSGVVLNPARKIGDIEITITLDLGPFKRAQDEAAWTLRNSRKPAGPMIDDLSNPSIIESTARRLD